MFDIGFTELLVVGIVALIVVGPEKLPRVIRTGVKYFRQFKQTVAGVRADVERELELDELRSNVTDAKDNMTKAVGYDALNDSLNELKNEAETFAEDTKNLASEMPETPEITDAEIEADLAQLSDDMGPTLPEADAEADTGVETTKQ